MIEIIIKNDSNNYIVTWIQSFFYVHMECSLSNLPFVQNSVPNQKLSFWVQIGGKHVIFFSTLFCKFNITGLMWWLFFMKYWLRMLKTSLKWIKVRSIFMNISQERKMFRDVKGFAGYRRVVIHCWCQRFVNLAFHFFRARSALILSRLHKAYVSKVFSRMIIRSFNLINLKF